MKKYLFLFALFVLFVGCGTTKIKSDAATTKFPDSENWVEDKIADMTLDQKIGQLFVIRPGAIDPTISIEELKKARGKGSVSVTEEMKKFFAKYPAGGFALFAKNIKDPVQIKNFNEQLHFLGAETRNIEPFIYVDEEGGDVARIAGNPNFNVPVYESMAAVGKKEKPADAYAVGAQIGAYLKKYGFDVDFAPVADVFTNPENTVIGTRAFSTDPFIASKMVMKYLEGLNSRDIKGCVKHFPGHGDTDIDSHYGLPETRKNWDELQACEMITFKEAIACGAQMIMTAHITVPEVTGNGKPATVSYEILTGKLRNELGFKGVIITDALEMDAISLVYPKSVEKACVDAVLAGADILLMPLDYKKAFEAVKKAVESGIISEKRIDESVKRILLFKENIIIGKNSNEHYTELK